MDSLNSPSSLRAEINFSPAPVIETSNEIGLHDVWQMLVQSKWIIVATTVLGLAAASIAVLKMVPKYQADVLFTHSDDGKSGGLASLGGQLGGVVEMAGINLSSGASAKEAALAYLKSREFLERFIKEKNLLPVLYPTKWDAAENKWNVQDENGIPTFWDAYRYFSKDIMSVTTDKKTGLIILSIEWKDRRQAVDWANELIKGANFNLRQKAISETELSLSYLERELQKTSIVEVQQAIFKVMETQIKTKMMANVQEQFAFKVIDPAALMNEGAYVKPKRSLFLTLGLLTGLMLGVFIAFVRKALKGEPGAKK